MGILDIFGSHSKRELKKINPIIIKIIALEDEYKKLSDSELKKKTEQFKKRLSDGEDMDNLVPEAFATVRETSDRVLGQRHFISQLIGGVMLYQGCISEMKTGEGKTLAATLPSYLNALTGKGVHIVTVNDYLATRDSEWMGKIHSFLGLKVGLIVHGITDEERRQAYAADITYGTNNEFGFDYLRDNRVIYKEDMVQRGHNYAIVDEVDSILIDEARTPLIISGHGEKSDLMYEKANNFVKHLKPLRIKEMDTKESYEDVDADYVVEEKNKNAVLTARGIEKAQQAFGIENLADQTSNEIHHYIIQSIKAFGTMQVDVDYVVKDGEVIIVDEFTGRLMFGRRYSNGLHQAIEAKEGVKIENESKTLATITFQNYFRIYGKLAGMTGTAITEEDEFRQIYNLDVIEIPTNEPMIRIDYNDRIYKTEAGKFNAVIKHIAECNKKGQPVLVGTITIEKSELLSGLLKKNGIPHNVLNAKYHEKEASIIAQAGRKGTVTIATNMAGRGTDIVLGGNAEVMAKNEMAKEGFNFEYIAQATTLTVTEDPEVIRARLRYTELYNKHIIEVKREAKEVIAAGGLYIIGTERHESRRIDNQLRGRSGRQGDIGESCFYLSLEDELMRLFGGDRVSNVASMLNLPEDQPIDAKILSNTIESAQKKVEGMNFARRKRTLEYDDVINQQRTLIYGQRKKVLDGEDLKTFLTKMIEDVVDNSVAKYLAGEEPDNWDFNGLRDSFLGIFLTKYDLNYVQTDLNYLTKDMVRTTLLERAMASYARSEEENTPEKMREIERVLMLRTVDIHWMDHIDAMDDLRQGVSLRAYSNRDPVVEYKFESYDMFEEMINVIKYETIKNIMLVRIKQKEIKREQVAKVERVGQENVKNEKPRTVVKKASEKAGRNDLCPCGSGKKYKKCCGKE